MKSPAARIVLGVCLVAAAGPAGFLVYRVLLGSPPAAATSFAPSSASGTSVGGVPAPAEAARAIPERLPDLTMPDAQGKPRRLADWRGRPLIVNFWATWCEPCRREIPLLEQLRRKSSTGLEVVGIAVDKRDAVLPYARQMGIEYPLLMGEEEGIKAVDAFGMQAVFPFSVFADRQGRIVGLKVGELHPDEAQLILDRVQAVDTGRLSLASARTQVTAGLQNLAMQHVKDSG